MERIPSSPPQIAPLPEETTRPLWSVMIPVYNCSRFIPDAVLSVLNQDPGEDQMQIEVVDDGSTDGDVEALVMSLGKGRVKYYRQPQNVGSLRNFETCINRANGHLVHLLHGDDRVKDGFYKKFTSLFEDYPDAGAAFCGYSTIDEQGSKIKDYNLIQSNKGLITDVYPKMASGLPVQYATMVVKRVVYERLGGFYGVIAGEDWEMWTRIAEKYPIGYIPEFLGEYRRFLGTISWPFIEKGTYAKSLAKTALLIESQLQDDLKWVMKKTKKKRAISCVNIASFIWKDSRNLKIVYELVIVALKLTPTSSDVYGKIIKLKWRILKDSFFNSNSDSLQKKAPQIHVNLGSENNISRIN
ncbi:glycosyltransferase family 2 protein [Aquiflexum gelatinilyticum]|uniref:glycosyltransferase family 2 protein n=1 Tax=Aquiflexum gelatinilyticum TaxID=2961943 RepID=UPI0021680B10|nr:glycosyltransferase [Aquiflexum gelatinilyticum]MCS4436597.1 glycosyltransferase [Aquiflexum gelatinilyticum]